MNNLSVIDLVFAGFILLLLVHGYMKGFIKKFFSWAALVAASVAAVRLYPAAAAFIRANVKFFETMRYVPDIFAFAGVFLAAFVVVTIVVNIIEHILKNVMDGAIGGVNKLFGAVFGLVEGVVFTALAVFFLSVQPVFDVSTLLEESFFARVLLPFVIIPLKEGSGTLIPFIAKLAEIHFPG